MFFWFLGVGPVFVWSVFRSPGLDYRLVMLGAVLPLGEVLLGGPRIAHTLLFAVVLLAAVMVVTRSRRLVRRRWIGLAIGVLMHLVLDGGWADATVFWWPVFGFGFPDVPVPELAHGTVVTLLLEVVGLVALGWSWVTFGFDDPQRRAGFLRTGRLPREPAAP